MTSVFHIREQTAQGGFRSLVLATASGSTECELVPERGALLTRWRVGTDEVFYLDEATLADASKNVRGGNPVLFPFAGKLPEDRFTHAGRTWSLPQHGFARKLPWTVRETGTDAHCAWVECGLVSTPETLAVFPWPFDLRLRYVLEGTSLTVETLLHNPSAEPLPRALGFHPYFRVPDATKGRAGVRTDAKRAWDNVQKKPVLVKKIDFTQPELDLHLLDHSPESMLIRRGSERGLLMSWSGYRVVVLWTLAGKDFVCVEPWEAPGGALSSGDGLRWIGPGETSRTHFRLDWGAK